MHPSVSGSPRIKCCREGKCLQQKHTSSSASSDSNQLSAECIMYRIVQVAKQNDIQTRQQLVHAPLWLSKSFKLFSASSKTESLTAFHGTLLQESTFSMKAHKHQENRHRLAQNTSSEHLIMSLAAASSSRIVFPRSCHLNVSCWQPA